MESVLAIKVRTGELDAGGRELARRRLRADVAQARIRVGPTIDEGHYRANLNKDIAAKSRIEAAFLVFNPDVFPHSRYSIAEVNFELALLFLHGIVTEKGKQLIEQYTNERNKKLSHGQKV